MLLESDSGLFRAQCFIRHQLKTTHPEGPIRAGTRIPLLSAVAEALQSTVPTRIVIAVPKDCKWADAGVRVPLTDSIICVYGVRKYQMNRTDRTLLQLE